MVVAPRGRGAYVPVTIHQTPVIRTVIVIIVVTGSKEMADLVSNQGMGAVGVRPVKLHYHLRFRFLEPAIISLGGLTNYDQQQTPWLPLDLAFQNSQV